MIGALVVLILGVLLFIYLGKKEPTNNSAPKNSRSQQFYSISDKYNTLEDVQNSLRQNGLEASELIVGVDFTKSNQWSGERSFQGKSLHHIEPLRLNPYQEVLRVIAQTLSAFDDDQFIPCYGFGDQSTSDKALFSFLPNELACHGLQEAEFHYQNIASHVTLSGPTSFAPLIYKAINVIREKQFSYHILLIIADGQVTNEKETVDAIVAASEYPLSIVMVGVGDGPWEMMEEFDDLLPQRKFDNFQFVNFHEVIQQAGRVRANHQTAFALQALMELPEQYQLIRKLGLLDASRAKALPRPVHVRVVDPPYFSAMPQVVPTPVQTSDDVPHEFVCPITHEIFQDPVIATDGFTYEREAIQQWIDSGRRVSPMSNQALGSTALVPNHNLRSQIQSWRGST